jgi:hypothetical protein
MVAAAKLVAAWPEGNDASCGSGTSVFGSGYRSGGRGRSKSVFKTMLVQSATATAMTVSRRTPQRR